MKTLYLTFHRISQHFKNHRLIFALYLICVFASSLAFTFFWGNLGGSGVFILENRDLFLTYNVSLGETLRSGDARLSALVDKGYGEYIVRGTAGLDVSGSNVMNPDVPPETRIPVSASSAGFEELSLIYGNMDFSEGGTLAVLPYMSVFSAEKVRAADAPTLVLDGKSFSVTGVQEKDDSVMIPFDAFLEGDYEITNLTVVTPTLLTESEAETMRAGIAAVLPSASVEDPYQRYASYLALEDASRFAEILMASLLFAAAFLSFMFMMKYLMELSRGEDAIFLLLGATRGSVALLSLLEILLLGVLSSGAAILLHAALYRSVFRMMNLYVNAVYTARDYLLVILIPALVSTVVSFPFLTGLARNTAVVQKNKYQ